VTDRERSTLRVLLWIVGFVVLVAAGAIGYVFGNSNEGEEAAPTSTVQGAIPESHKGQNLPVGSIGDARKGAQLFTSKGCSSCHSYGGSGGTDAPPLDSMKGHLSASEIADMSGIIWNHVPAMLPHFKEEGISFPTFTGNEMADLIAYLHGGAPGGKAMQKTKGMKGMGKGMKGKGKGMTTGQTTTGGGANGEQLFTSSCGSCHTLAAAGTSGTVGPNLDDLKPSEQIVLNAIETGPGAMPPGLYFRAEAKAVAQYVAQNAGK
jgi:mono/diheme cytochrome c family protein